MWSVAQPCVMLLRRCRFASASSCCCSLHGQLSNSELARALGISESNAGTRLHRALTRLREHCAEAGREEVA